MTFKPGTSGNPKGRPLGSKNKWNVYEVLENIEINGKKGFNPFEHLAHLAVYAEKETVRCHATAELCSYVGAKLKSLDVTLDDKPPFNITLNLGPSNEEKKAQIKVGDLDV